MLRGLRARPNEINTRSFRPIWKNCSLWLCNYYALLKCTETVLLIFPFIHNIPLPLMFLCFSSSVIFLLVDACVGLNWLLVSFLSHVNKNIIHSFIHSFFIQTNITVQMRPSGGWGGGCRNRILQIRLPSSPPSSSSHSFNKKLTKHSF